MNNNAKTQGSKAVESAAERYANELDAQFRTLNNFVSHGGEVGRAHEYYLRGVLSRFLPDSIKLGSGFIASPNWTSKQQDIIIYMRDFTTLFQVGDCVVVDYKALVGTIEVKTTLGSSKKFIESLHSIKELEGTYRNPGLRALYAWDGINLETTLKAIWKFVEEAPDHHHCRLPHVIYVRGKYLLMAKNKEISFGQPPFFFWRVGTGGITDGQALLLLVCSVWRFGLPKLLPWWLLSCHDYHGHLSANAKSVPWPQNLSAAVANRQ